MSLDADQPQSAVETGAATLSYYRDMHAACGAILNASFNGSNAVTHARAHSYVRDLEVWLGILTARAESVIIDSAIREYQHALLSLALGQYRQAFAALRLYLELAVGAVYFSANEMLLREWLHGRRDNSWRRSTKLPSSVFSQRFARAFSPELENEVEFYGGIASTTYRDCSQFVHANVGNRTPSALAFDQALFDTWHQLAGAAKLVVTFALSLRYLDELSPTDREKIEAGLIEQLGHIAAIRIKLGSSTV